MEGIIKSVTCDQPVVLTDLGGLSVCLVKIVLDAKALADLYTQNGLDPADFNATYIVSDGDLYTEEINLAEAAATGHELSTYYQMNLAFSG